MYIEYRGDKDKAFDKLLELECEAVELNDFELKSVMQDSDDSDEEDVQRLEPDQFYQEISDKFSRGDNIYP